MLKVSPKLHTSISYLNLFSLSPLFQKWLAAIFLTIYIPSHFLPDSAHWLSSVHSSRKLFSWGLSHMEDILRPLLAPANFLDQVPALMPFLSTFCSYYWAEIVLSMGAVFKSPLPKIGMLKSDLSTSEWDLVFLPVLLSYKRHSILYKFKVYIKIWLHICHEMIRQ